MKWPMRGRQTTVHRQPLHGPLRSRKSMGVGDGGEPLNRTPMSSSFVELQRADSG